MAYKTFEQFLRRAATEEVPPRIDAACLGRWKIAGGNESALVTSLKSLELIDAEGRPTAEYREIRLSAPRRQASLRRCARAAYAGLDGAVDGVVDEDRLRDYFKEERGLLGQMVDKATRFYRHLEAALISRGDAPDQPRIAGPAVSEPQSARPSGPMVSVQVPFGASEAELADFFRRLMRAWRQAVETGDD